MASLLTTAGRLALCKSATDWDTATHKAMLLRPTYVPDVAHGTVNLISSYEVSGTGYAGGYGGSGRKTVTSPTVTTDSAGRVVFDAADLTWSSLDAGVVGFVAIVRETGGADTSSVVVAILTYPVTDPAGSDLVVTWASTGLFYLT